MKTLNQAPNYAVNEKNEIVNVKSGKPVAIKNGKVRLMTEEGRKSFKVSDLLETTSEDKQTKKGKGWSRANKNESKDSSSSEAKTSTKSKVVIKKKSKAEDKAEAKAEKKNKKTPAQLIKEGIYPYKIKNLDEIKSKIEELEVGDTVKFKDYQTKKTVKGTIVSHTKFHDHYPGARVKIGKGKEAKRKIISYLKLTKVEPKK